MFPWVELSSLGATSTEQHILPGKKRRREPNAKEIEDFFDFYEPTDGEGHRYVRMERDPFNDKLPVRRTISMVLEPTMLPQRGSRPESVSGFKGVYTRRGIRGYLVNITPPKWKGAMRLRTFSTAREAGCARDAVEFYSGQDFEYNNPELEGTFPPLPAHLRLDSVDDLQKITEFVQKQACEAACRAKKDRGERGGSSSLRPTLYGCARDAVEFYSGQDFEYNNPELEGTFPPLPAHLRLDSVDDLQKIIEFVHKQACEAACRAKKDRGERGGSSSLRPTLYESEQLPYVFLGRAAHKLDVASPGEINSAAEEWVQERSYPPCSLDGEAQTQTQVDKYPELDSQGIDPQCGIEDFDVTFGGEKNSAEERVQEIGYLHKPELQFCNSSASSFEMFRSLELFGLGAASTEQHILPGKNRRREPNAKEIEAVSADVKEVDCMWQSFEGPDGSEGSECLKETESEDDGSSGDVGSAKHGDSQAEVTGDSSGYETNSNHAGRKRKSIDNSADLIAKLIPLIKIQVEDSFNSTLLPLVAVLRSREEHEQNHREQILALEKEKLALKRERLRLRNGAVLPDSS